MLSTRPDHVAAVVPDIPRALERWSGTLGGVTHWDFHNPARFRGANIAFTGGAKLELLMPSDAEAEDGTLGGPSGFVEAFLERFGAQVHHVTLKVPDLLEAVEQLRSAGVEPVDVDTSEDTWHEAFVPPSVVGGLIVQIAATTLDDQGWAEHEGSEGQGDEPPRPADDGAVLRGPTLSHTDLGAATEIWTLLGGQVNADGEDALVVRWPDEPLDVRIERGQQRGPLGLRFRGADPRPQDPALGPAVLTER